MEDKMFNDIIDAIIDNASEEEIEIIREKLNDYLINHLYDSKIHKELSDNFDSSLCPHCKGRHIIKYGKNKKGYQRYLCKDCLKTFSSITGSLLSYTKKQPYQWYEYIQSLFNGDTLSTSAKIAGICEQTSLVWRHKILSILASLTDNDPVLSDTVYLDEKLNVISHPGKHIEHKEKPKRGMSNQKRNIVCAIDQHNNKVIQVSETGRIHSDTLYEIYKDKIPSSCQVVSDSLRSYHKLMKDLGVTWIKIPSGKKEKDGYTLKKINDLHSSIDLFLYKYRGISDRYLRNYIGLYKYKNQHYRYYQKVVFIHIFKEIVNSLCALKFKDFGYDSKLATV